MEVSPEVRAKLEEQAQGIAAIIGPAFDQVGAAFCLIGGTIGDGGWLTFVTNVDRRDLRALLVEMIEKIDAAEVEAPTGGPAAGRRPF